MSNIEFLETSIQRHWSTILRIDPSTGIPGHAMQQSYLPPKQGGAGIIYAPAALASALIASMLECDRDVETIFLIARFSAWNQPAIDGEDPTEIQQILQHFIDYHQEEAIQAGQQLKQARWSEAEYLYTVLKTGFDRLEHHYEQANERNAKTTAKAAADAGIMIPQTILGEAIDWPTLPRLKEERLKTQKLINQAVKVALRREFIINHVLSQPHHVGRLFSASEEGEALMTTIPAWNSLRFPSDGQCFRLALSLRFGLPLQGLVHSECQCRNGDSNHIDPHGYHLFAACNLKGNGKIYRHEALKREVAELLSAVGYHVKLESSDTIQLSQPESGQRTDITILDYTPGKVADIDVSIVDSRKLFYGANGSFEPNLNNLTAGKAAMDTEHTKRSTYEEAIHSGGHYFFPFIMEYLGRWGPAMKDFFKHNLAERLKSEAKAAEDRDKYCSQWKRRLTVAMIIAATYKLRQQINDAMDRNHAQFKATHDYVQRSPEELDNIDEMAAMHPVWSASWWKADD